MKLNIYNYHSETFESLEISNLLHLGSKTSAVFQKRDKTLKNASYTIIVLEPALTVSLKGRTATFASDDAQQEQIEFSGCPFEFLNKVQTANLPRFNAKPPAIDFPSGLIGYFGFALVNLVEDIPNTTQKRDPFQIPCARVLIPKTMIYIDHKENTLYVITQESRQYAESLAKTAVQLGSARVDMLKARAATSTNFSLQPVMKKQAFLERAIEAKKYIEEGQCFQIVLSQRFFGQTQVDGASVFTALLESAPSAYNYLLNFPDFQYVGASPETMVSVREKNVRLCALAGTRPRGRTRKQDLDNEAELQSNAKELAEHMMLVDLGRNDLGKICLPGSIQVGQVAQVLRYSNVMHLGTEIFGSLAPGQNAFTALKACFPRGTVSGAPKIRALELLARLEPEQRGIYAGAVGFIAADGQMDTAIAIRSALLKDGVAHINAGAGIVHDSDPEAEYFETINKSSAIAQILTTSARGKVSRLFSQGAGR